MDRNSKDRDLVPQFEHDGWRLAYDDRTIRNALPVQVGDVDGMPGKPTIARAFDQFRDN